MAFMRRGGTRVGSAYIPVTVDGSGVNEEIVDTVDGATADVENSGDEAGERYGDRFSDRFMEKVRGMRGNIAARLRSDAGDAGEDAGNLAGDRASRSFSQRVTDRLFDDDFADRIGDRFAQRFVAAIEDNLARGTLGQTLADLVSGNGDESSITSGGGTSRSDSDFDISRLFGAGSRNNALNLFGRSIGFITDKLPLLWQQFSLAPKFFSGFSEGISKAATDAGFFQKVLSGIQGGLSAVGVSLPTVAALGAAAPAVLIAMSALISSGSALLAILTSIVGTIASGLVGALVVGGGAFAAAAAGVGLLTVALTSMTDAQREALSTAFTPLKEGLTGLGQLLLTDLVPAFSVWAGNLRDVLALLSPLAQIMSGPLADAGTILTESLSGPGIQALLTSLGVWLPKITTDLSRGLGDFLNGIGGVLAAVMPFVRQFSKYLADVSERFADWSASAEGQNSIVDFVGRAVVSLKSLWNFVREVSGLITDVLFSPEAQSLGNSIFDSLADSFAGFREKIADGSLQRWFAEGAAFGEKLWDALRAIFGVFVSFYDSGVLEAMGTGLEAFAMVVDALNSLLAPTIDLLGYALPVAIAAALTPIELVAVAIVALVDAVRELGNWLSNVPGLDFLNSGDVDWSGDVLSRLTTIKDQWTNAFTGGGPSPLGTISVENDGPSPLDDLFSGLSFPDLMESGKDALNKTSEQYGGYLSDEWKNPYEDYANSLVKEGPTVARMVSLALVKTHREIAEQIDRMGRVSGNVIQSADKQAARAIETALTSDTGAGAIDALGAVSDRLSARLATTTKKFMADARSTAQDLRQAADDAVTEARNRVNSAAQSLASATSEEDAQAALGELNRAQAALSKAQQAQDRIYARAAALVRRAEEQGDALSATVERITSRLDQQAVLTTLSSAIRIDGQRITTTARALAEGLDIQNATLADFARAREILSGKIERANARLADAIAMRDDYRDQVADSIKQFGSLLTAQASVIDGVEQALTANDIIGNLEDRLAQIRAFQSNLQILLSRGLSKSAYKQLLAAGVEQGGAYAEALIAGGTGAVGQVNDLVSDINSAAGNLGDQASKRMYQAGVNAAKGLVDGLESLSDRLDRAATRLGNRIAKSLEEALGIHSPSRRAIDMMDSFGDGAVIGLDRQHGKVGNAAARLSDRIAISPEAAAYASGRGSSDGVSGNNPDQRFRDLIVNTPTEDPEAVAHEVLNEVVGRLP